MNVALFGTDTLSIRRSKYKAFKDVGLFYKSVDEIPSNTLSSFSFIILSGLDKCANDFELLRQHGINPDHISFFEKIEWRKGCSFLGQYLWFGRSYYRSCVYRRGEFLYVDYSGNIPNDFKLIKRKWEETQEHWRKKELTPCDGCILLKEGLWPKHPKMKSLSLYGGFKGEHCNFKCVYCDATENLKLADKDGLTMVDAIKTFIKINKTADFSIALSAGEITVSPHKKEIFDILQKNNIRVSVFSNGLIFDDDIYNVLQKHHGSLDVSLDAGTSETFFKIKGVNMFYKVLDTISRYSESNGKLELKYIILEGVNDNYEDVDGFISICEKYASSVRISCDKFRYQERLSEGTFSLIQHIIDKCKVFSLPVAFSYSQFNDLDCERLKMLQK